MAPTALRGDPAIGHADLVTSTRTLAIDCGGGGLKASVLDERGAMLVKRIRVETPYPMPPEVFVSALCDLADRLPRADRATVGMPGMIRHGKVIATPHYVTTKGPFSPVDPVLARAWSHFDAQTALTEAFGMPTKVVNDAEVHGASVVSGEGLEVMFTLGTGLGCAVFDDGRLLPKLELSRAPVRKGIIYDEWVGNRARRRLGNWVWSKRVRSAIDGLRPMFLWDHLYVGGGNAKKLTVDLGPEVTLVPNEAGVTGGIRLWDLDATAGAPPTGGTAPGVVRGSGGAASD